MTHSPAPWFIVYDVPNHAIGYRAIVDDEGYTVCDPSPMGEANARLIANAPALYAALDQLLRVTVDADIRAGFVLTEAEHEAREQALEVFQRITA